MLIEPYRLEIKEMNFFDEDIPTSFNDLKIVFFADIHHGLFFSQNRIKKIVKKVNSLNPDIIFVGGDYVGNFLFEQPKYIKPSFLELKNLKAELGVFGVIGNHDARADTKLSIEEMEKADIIYLGNKGQWLEKNGDKIRIGGVKDYFEGTQNISNVVKDIAEEDFAILLSHSPDFAEKIDNNKIDIVLAGHTHGGQITFFGLWAPITSSRYGQKYKTGLVDAPNTKVLVTNGVGSFFPIRFFARPQINIVNLKSKQ